MESTAPEGKSYFFINVGTEALYKKYKMTGQLEKQEIVVGVQTKRLINIKIDL